MTCDPAHQKGRLALASVVKPFRVLKLLAYMLKLHPNDNGADDNGADDNGADNANYGFRLDRIRSHLTRTTPHYTEQLITPNN